VDFRVFDRIEDAAEAWHDLQGRAAAITPFQRIDWHRSIIGAFGLAESAQLRLVVGYENARPMFLAPLVLTDRLGCRILSWLGDFRADYNGAVFDRSLAARPAEERADLLAASLEAAGPHDLVWLEKQPDGALARDLPRFHATRHFYRAHALTLGQTWQETFEQLYSKSTRRRLGEKERQLGRKGLVEFRRATGRAAIDTAVRELMRWKRLHLRRQGQASPFGARDPDFFVRLANDTPLARVFSLSLGGRNIAVCFTLKQDRTLYIYQMAYDPQAATASPGQILLNKVLELAIGEGCRTADFTIGDEAYKLKLCDRSSDVVRAWSASTAKGLVLGSLLHFNGLARDFAAGHPTLRPLVQRTRRAFYARADARRQQSAAAVGVPREVR
jgi:CelD/BcsL family acetyltransferase involved in cellulose biosynthesis